jgi:hypothetical protein
MPAGKQAYLFIQLAVLLAIPSVLRHIDHGSVPVVDFYGMWWLVGLMPVMGEAIRRLGERTGIAAPPRYSVGLYTLLPWLSLIAHVGILHYVYDIPFFGAMAAPVLLGFTFVLHSAMPESTRQLPFRMLPENFRQLRILRAIAPWAAVLVSLNNPHELAVALHPLSAATLTTTMLAVAAGYLTYIYCLFPAKAPAMLSAGAAAALVAIYGPSAQQMQQTSDQLWTWCKTTIANAIPTTLVGWGAISVIASFGFLAIGAAVSLAGGRLPVPAAGLPANGIPSESE